MKAAKRGTKVLADLYPPVIEMNVIQPITVFHLLIDRIKGGSLKAKPSSKISAEIDAL